MVVVDVVVDVVVVEVVVVSLEGGDVVTVVDVVVEADGVVIAAADCDSVEVDADDRSMLHPATMIKPAARSVRTSGRCPPTIRLRATSTVCQRCRRRRCVRDVEPADTR